MIEVCVLDDDAHRASDIAPWGTLGQDVAVHFFTRFDDEDSLVAAIAASDVIVVMRERTPISARLLDRLPALRLIITTGMANASIDLDAAAQRGITVTGTASNGAGVVELTWALILAVSKRIVEQGESLRAGTWQTALVGNLAGRTLGLLGFGRLGQAMVPAARAFGMEIIAWSANLKTDEAERLGVAAVDRAELFSRSDVLSIHTRLSERTAGLVGAPELSSMKSTAILVNTSRGQIVDEDALVDALQKGTIGGVGLDVFHEEPIPADHPLFNAPNAVLVPHLGYASEDNISLMYREAVEDIVAFLADAPIRVLRAPST